MHRPPGVKRLRRWGKVIGHAVPELRDGSGRGGGRGREASVKIRLRRDRLLIKSAGSATGGI